MAHYFSNIGAKCLVDFEYLCIYDDDVIEVRMIEDYPAENKTILNVFNKDMKLHHTYFWKDYAYFIIRYYKKDIKHIEIIRSDETNIFNWNKED